MALTNISGLWICNVHTRDTSQYVFGEYRLRNCATMPHLKDIKRARDGL